MIEIERGFSCSLWAAGAPVPPPEGAGVFVEKAIAVRSILHKHYTEHSGNLFDNANKPSHYGGMRRRRHGLRGGGSKRSLEHSDCRSKEHQVSKLRKGSYGGSLVSYPTIESPKPLPKFVEAGSLVTTGNLCWVVEDGELKGVSGEAMRERFAEFERQVQLAGGPQREQSKSNKYGEPYLQSYDTDVHKRNTVAVPPWFSKIWAMAPSEWREKGKDMLSGLVLRLAKERWPEADIRGITLHDDTSNLHFDIWATELKAREVTIRKNKVVRYVTKNTFPSGLVGPGTTYLQMKKDIGHRLHSIDEGKLTRSLEQYKIHRALTKKPLPEVPAEITLARKMEGALTGFFKSPDLPKKVKTDYLEHCKVLDSAKYSTYDKIDEVHRKSLELNEMETDFQEKWEELAEKEKELAEKEKEVQERLERIVINDKPSLDFIIGRWENSEKFRQVIRNAPKSTTKLLGVLGHSKDPQIQKLVVEIRASMGGPNIPE